MTHTLSADAGFGNLNATFIADNAFVTNLLIFTAVTFPVLARSENSFTEQAILFRFQSTVIDGFRFLYFTSGPFTNHFRRCKSDFDGIKINWLFCWLIIHIRHRLLLPYYPKIQNHLNSSSMLQRTPEVLTRQLLPPAYFLYIRKLPVHLRPCNYYHPDCFRSSE